MGTYVPQRVAKLSRAISRLQRWNVGRRKERKARARCRVEKERSKKTRRERSRVGEVTEGGSGLPKGEKSGGVVEGGGRRKGEGTRRNGAMESICR